MHFKIMHSDFHLLWKYPRGYKRIPEESTSLSRPCLLSVRIMETVHHCTLHYKLLLWKENSCYSILILFFSLNRIRRWQYPILTRVLPISLSHLVQNSRKKKKNKYNENGLTYLHKHSNNGLNFNVCVGIFNSVESFGRSNSPSHI